MPIPTLNSVFVPSRHPLPFIVAALVTTAIVLVGARPASAREDASANLLHNGGFETCELTLESRPANPAGNDCVHPLEPGRFRARVAMPGWRVVGHNYLWSQDSTRLGSRIEAPQGGQFATLYQDTATAFSDLVQDVRDCRGCRSDEWLASAPHRLRAGDHLRLSLMVDVDPWTRGAADGSVQLEAVADDGSTTTLAMRELPGDVEGWQRIELDHRVDDSHQVGHMLRVRVRNRGAHALALDDLQLEIEPGTRGHAFNGSFEQCRLVSASTGARADDEACEIVSQQPSALSYRIPGWRIDGHNPRPILRRVTAEDPQVARDGNQSLMILNNTDRDVTRLRQRVQLCDGCDDLASWSTGQPVPLVATTRYELRAEVRTELGSYTDPRGDIGLAGTRGSHLEPIWLASMPLPATGGRWRSIVLPLTVPADVDAFSAHELEIVIEVRGRSPVVIDNVRLHPVRSGPPARAATQVQVWTADAGRAVVREEPPPVDADPRNPYLLAARNEFVSFQIVVRPEDGVLEDLALESMLPRSAGPDMPAWEMAWKRVGYVPVGNDAVPDPLLPVPGFRADRGYASPIWIDVRVPRDAAPGLHHHEISLVSSSGWSHTVPVNIEVLPVTLAGELHGPLATSIGFEPLWHAARFPGPSLAPGCPGVDRRTTDALEDALIARHLNPDAYAYSLRCPAEMRSWLHRRIAYFKRGAKVFTVAKENLEYITAFADELASCRQPGAQCGIAPEDDDTWNAFLATGRFFYGDESDACQVVESDEGTMLVHRDPVRGECLRIPIDACVDEPAPEHAVACRRCMHIGRGITRARGMSERFADFDARYPELAPVSTWSAMRLWNLWSCDPEERAPAEIVAEYGVDALAIPSSVIEASARPGGPHEKVVSDIELQNLASVGIEWWSYHYDGHLGHPVAARAPLWIDHDRGASGYLYYNIAHWTDDAIDPRRGPFIDWTYGHAGTQGVLIYPNAWQPDRLISTLRLENLRDGIEDVEVLERLQGTCGSRVTSGFVESLGGTMWSEVESVPPELLTELRGQLLRALAHALETGECPPS